MTAEERRLEEARSRQAHWKRWGPYVSDRAWGTVREDYSADGTAWEYLPHDHARSRAYRWNEDGLAGISDRHQELCLALALWNGRDPILKERLFGLTGNEGNHGEDVKEYYFHLDSTPTHSFMRMLYKYPQAAFPYGDLVEENRRRDRSAPEYELIDTGVFEQDRYFDVFVEYAKVDAEDVLMQVTVCNRGPEAAPLHVLPTVWFRNTWSWNGDARKGVLEARPSAGGCAVMQADTVRYGRRWVYFEGAPELLFTENETNTGGCSASTAARRTQRTASTTMSCRASAARSIRCVWERRPPLTTWPTSGPAAPSPSGSGSHRTARTRWIRSIRSTRSSRSGDRKQTTSTRR